jgi:inhibitor of cysteine peptidase
MEKLNTLIILLIAAVLLVPGCYAEKSAMNESANATVPDVTIEQNITQGVNATEASTIETAATEADYTANVNTTNLTMKVNQTALISLKENPTTGFSWNVTNSTGLEIVNDTYNTDKAPESMVGVGGVHEWLVKAVEAGNQTFDAVYKRSWEPTTGSEDTYALNVTVE